MVYYFYFLNLHGCGSALWRLSGGFIECDDVPEQIPHLFLVTLGKLNSLVRTSMPLCKLFPYIEPGRVCVRWWEVWRVSLHREPRISLQGLWFPCKSASLTLEVLLCVYKAGVLVFRDTEE